MVACSSPGRSRQSETRTHRETSRGWQHPRCGKESSPIFPGVVLFSTQQRHLRRVQHRTTEPLHETYILHRRAGRAITDYSRGTPRRRCDAPFKTQHHLHPRRRSRHRRCRRLWAAENQDAEHRPNRCGGDALHGILFGPRGLRTEPLHADDRQAHGALRRAQQHAALAERGGAGADAAGDGDDSAAFEKGRLRDGDHRQVGPRDAGGQEQPSRFRLRSPLRLSLPGRGPHLLSAISLAR